MVDPRLLQAVGDFLLLCRAKDRPTILGIAGPQGSGKSTLGSIVAKVYGGVCISLDDVYLTRFERQQMAQTLHPTFATRGPPGTHDLDLLQGVLEALLSAGDTCETALPCFDKLTDERCARSEWPLYRGRPKVIVLEGWCLGVLPQSASELERPINRLEREQDKDGRWRRAINQTLVEGRYSEIAAMLDGLIYLRPPSFDVVLDWRSQQEAKLTGVENITPERRAEIDVFISYFERLTRWMMRGGIQSNCTIQLDENRQVVALSI